MKIILHIFYGGLVVPYMSIVTFFLVWGCWLGDERIVFEMNSVFDAFFIGVLGIPFLALATLIGSLVQAIFAKAYFHHKMGRMGLCVLQGGGNLYVVSNASRITFYGEMFFELLSVGVFMSGILLAIYWRLWRRG